MGALSTTAWSPALTECVLMCNSVFRALGFRESVGVGVLRVRWAQSGLENE